MVFGAPRSLFHNHVLEVLKLECTNIGTDDDPESKNDDGVAVGVGFGTNDWEVGLFAGRIIMSGWGTVFDGRFDFLVILLCPGYSQQIAIGRSCLKND